MDKVRKTISRYYPGYAERLLKLFAALPADAFGWDKEYSLTPDS